MLEIGADKCDLLPFLRSKGFEVWVIDVYDRFGGGTGVYEQIRAKYPDLKIVRSFMHEDRTLEAGFFDAVYSCSVIEHIPPQHMAATCRRIAEVLKSGGWSIHAIDCTVQGIMINTQLVGSLPRGIAARATWRRWRGRRGRIWRRFTCRRRGTTTGGSSWGRRTRSIRIDG